MLRGVLVCCTLAICFLLAGCSSESYDGLINNTITAMQSAGDSVGAVQKRVSDAVTKFEKGETPKLDLADAIKATDDIKRAGEEFQKIKRKVEQIRSNVTEADRKKYAEENKSRINDAFKTLVEKRDQLRKTLARADEIDKPKVDDLRKKLVEAESPFESLARQ